MFSLDFLSWRLKKIHGDVCSLILTAQNLSVWYFRLSLGVKNKKGQSGIKMGLQTLEKCLHVAGESMKTV